MKTIPLTRGKVAIVDSEDFEYLSQWKWNINHYGYAVRNPGIFMHRVVNSTPKGMHTDHINGDKLDNRKSNLRTATPSQNLRNAALSSRNTSGYKGVSWHKAKQKWRASIRNSGRQIELGYFADIADAVRARKDAEIQYHGVFARD